MLPEQVVIVDDDLESMQFIILSNRIGHADEVTKLNLATGAHIIKPFNSHELIAKIDALLRRDETENSTKSRSILQCKGLRMDLNRHEVTVNGQVVGLSRIQYELLKTLMENPGYVFTRNELIEQSLGYDYDGMERTIDSHIKNLRRKIEPDRRQPIFVETVFGLGYRLAHS